MVARCSAVETPAVIANGRRKLIRTPDFISESSIGSTAGTIGAADAVVGVAIAADADDTVAVGVFGWIWLLFVANDVVVDDDALDT